MHSNALAGIHLIRNENDEACKSYQKILDTERDFNFKFKIDNLQRIHCVHNYLYALQQKHPQRPYGEDLTIQLEALETDLKSSEAKYKGALEDKRVKEELKFEKKHSEVNDKLINVNIII